MACGDSSVTTPKKRQNLTKACDQLFSQLVRSVGRCEANDHKECSGPLQCAHGFSRRYRAVRWDRRNAWCLCASHHMRYTHNPILWDEWMQSHMRPEVYQEVRSLALGGEKVDLKDLLSRLRAESRAA